MLHEFEQLEDAALAALMPLQASTGVRTIEAYAGQLEVDDLSRIIIRFPCIYVLADGLQNTRSNNIDDCRLSLLLLVGDKNYRNNTAASRGDATSPGVYTILKAVRDALHRRKMFAAWSPICLVSEEPQVYEPKKGMCLYTAKYEMQAQRNL
jgi:phage gp37-like protein